MKNIKKKNLVEYQKQCAEHSIDSLSSEKEHDSILADLECLRSLSMSTLI